ncbi:MAG TPA: 4-hydroxyphenylpyruvate dioxygenase [Solirubrobacterales bacterium]|jgi:4-hydroxyphenylpyruvate dioxygenase|nr:4-hydroxyphenylpyruvate dioxygenase [Solirubrobacterales bacterium]
MEVKTARDAGSRIATPPVPKNDEMPLLGIDHIELYVGNGVQATHYFTHALGFRETAYAGLETGMRDRASHVVEQGRIRFLLTTPLHGSNEIARHIAEHGDGVKVVGLSVPDAEDAYRIAVRRGARGVEEPHEESDERGVVRLATIATYGETVHTFVERDGYGGAFLPGFESREGGEEGDFFKGIDHVVGNVELGRMEEWVDYYERVFGFTEMIRFSDEDISTEYSALMSKVMADGKGRIKFPINEPAEGQRKSQIEEYLEFYGGPGVQHLALATTDIVGTVRELQSRGVEFLKTPESYYQELPERIGEIDEDLADLGELGILADRDDEGYLLQIFGKPLSNRPTLFIEVIERHGARGFGEGNFKALFEAIEREQGRRGNL